MFSVDFIAQSWSSKVLAEEVRLSILSRWMVTFQDQPQVFQGRSHKQASMYNMENQVLKAAADQ